MKEKGEEKWLENISFYVLRLPVIYKIIIELQTKSLCLYKCLNWYYICRVKIICFLIRTLTHTHIRHTHESTCVESRIHRECVWDQLYFVFDLINIWSLEFLHKICFCRSAYFCVIQSNLQTTEKSLKEVKRTDKHDEIDVLPHRKTGENLNFGCSFSFKCVIYKTRSPIDGRRLMSSEAPLLLLLLMMLLLLVPFATLVVAVSSAVDNGSCWDNWRWMCGIPLMRPCCGAASGTMRRKKPAAQPHGKTLFE